jgi:hypothetical protein
MAKKKVKVKLGDIFAIKIEKNRYSYGQVVAEGRSSDCMVVYDIVNMEHPLLVEIVSNKIVFLIQTVNSRIEDGIWEVIGNAPIPDNITFPLYKERNNNGFRIVRHDGSIFKEDATESEVENLKVLISRSPVSLEKAIKAKYSNSDWDSYYNDLIYLG